MKRLNIFIALLLMVSFSSCLTSGLEDLPEYDEAIITNFKFEYRWFDDDENKMCVKQLNVKTKIDNENLVVLCDIKVPAADKDFPATVREQVSISNIVGYCDISTAAVVAPVGDSPKLGEIQDFNAKGDMLYKVTAANGDSKVWTMKINSFSK